MSNTEKNKSISDEDFDIILDACWEQVALFAFEQLAQDEAGEEE